MPNVEQIRYAQALASIKLVAEAGMLDLTEEDYEFLTMAKPWVANERSRVRRVVESAVYGSLDYLGLPRFAAPAEFIAGAIAYYVHPVNCMTACTIMDGAEFSENVINGVDRPVRAQEIFAMVIQVKSGEESFIERTQKTITKKLKGA